MGVFCLPKKERVDSAWKMKSALVCLHGKGPQLPPTSPAPFHSELEEVPETYSGSGCVESGPGPSLWEGEQSFHSDQELHTLTLPQAGKWSSQVASCFLPSVLCFLPLVSVTPS